MTAEDKEKIKTNIPVNHSEVIRNLLRTPKMEEKYINPIIERIISKGLIFIPEFRIELRDLDNDLIKKCCEDPEDFLKIFKEGLYERLTFIPEIKELMTNYDIKSDDLHLIPDSTGMTELIPRITDLSINKTRFKGRLTILEGRFMNLGIDKRTGFNSIKFRCTSCLREFEKYYFNNIDDRIRSPSHCINQKCKNMDF